MASFERHEDETRQTSHVLDRPSQEPSVIHTQTSSSNPIELSEMSQSQATQSSTFVGNGTSGHDNTAHDIGIAQQQNSQGDAQLAGESASNPKNHQPNTLPTTSTSINEDPTNSTPPPLTREATRPAIGPATDKPSPVLKEKEIEGPVLYITLLLTTGARHPFRLDRKYLRKRNVEVEGNNPINMSLYKLKELILRDWREEWEAKPSSPESIRLILMGKLLTDKSKLAEIGFKDGAAPAIVHMTIKPQEIVDEDEANKNTREREGNERSPGCRCTIM